MASRAMSGGISYNVRVMVTKMNAVGINRIKAYCKRKHPKTDFNRCLAITRDVAMVGYAGVCTKYNISRQRAEQVVKTIYKYACEIEKEVSRQNASET